MSALRSYRTAAGLTQARLAELMSGHGEPVTQALVSHYETGRVSITPERAVQIELATEGAVTRSDLRPDIWPPSKKAA